MIEKKPSRWGLLSRQASVLGRFKNKLRLKKLEWKKFYEQFWGPTLPISDPEDDINEWPGSCYSTEGNLTSRNNSLYFDSSSSEDYWAHFRQEQFGNSTPTRPGDPSLEPESCPVVPFTFRQDTGTCAQGEELHLTQATGDFEKTTLPGNSVVGTSGASEYGHHQLPTPRLDHTNSFDSCPLSVDDYAGTEHDEISECLPLDFYRSEQQALFHLDTDNMRGMNMRYPGESSNMPFSPGDQLQLLKQMLELNSEEAFTRPFQASTELGLRVMVRIVCACRKLSKLIRRRRVDEIKPSLVTVRRKNRVVRENRSQLHKGVRRRNDKWVSEIRVGQTNEKIWLGSYETEKEAALAFDAGKYYCSSQRRCSYNFPESSLLLGPHINIHELSPVERKKTIQKLAEDYVKAYMSGQN